MEFLIYLMVAWIAVQLAFTNDLLDKQNKLLEKMVPKPRKQSRSKR